MCNGTEPKPDKAERATESFMLGCCKTHPVLEVGNLPAGLTAWQKERLADLATAFHAVVLALILVGDGTGPPHLPKGHLVHQDGTPEAR